MRPLTTLTILCAAFAFAFAAAGCGSTSYGPGGPPAAASATNSDTVNQNQDPAQQPDQGGLKTPAYTAAHNSCSLYDLKELARQNNVKATPQAVAKVYQAGETTAVGKKQAYQGCLDAINGK
jgi:hypothetical protein